MTTSESQKLNTFCIELKDITKKFPGVTANDCISFNVRKGEVHALLGENGAGKSTLMNILAGLYRPDAGSVRINGVLRRFSSPHDADEAGIGMVHQHFTLAPGMTVSDNIILGFRKPFFRFENREIKDKIRKLSKEYGLAVSPDDFIYDLSVGEQQRVEILKVLYRGADILILDEPTSVLTPQEVQSFFNTLHELKKRSSAIIFITHKLSEVLHIADRVTVLRKGRIVSAELKTDDMTESQLAELMVGDSAAFEHEKPETVPGEVKLSFKKADAEDDRGLPALKNINLDVRAGEILGVAGVAGNGQKELAEAAAGLRPLRRGKVVLKGKDMTGKGPLDFIRTGLAYVPEERIGVGTAPDLSIRDNLILKDYRTRPLSKSGLIRRQAVNSFCNGLIGKFRIKTSGPDVPVKLLSGGNIQKVVLARELSGNPDILVVVHPTRGLDIGAIAYVHDLLQDSKAKGCAVLMVGEDLDELLEMSDRMIVMYDGAIAGHFDAQEFEKEKIGLLMAGGKGE